MDIWGGIWIVLAIVFFPFGYKPLLLLLVLSSIFQASSAFAFGPLNMPLAPFIEILFILRLFLPLGGKGFVSFRNKTVLMSFLLIGIVWGYTFLAANLFSGIRVYSSLQSFELNFITHGVPLRWSGANINQLIILSLHILTLGFVYYRRNEIDRAYFMKCIVFTLVVFISFCLIWKFTPGIYSVISPLIFNNTSYSITAIYEARAAGTFSEPSLAGLYIGSLAVPLLCTKNWVYKLIGICTLGIFLLNLSTTGLFTILISIPVIFIIMVRKTIRNYMYISFLSMILAVGAMPISEILSSYAAQKSASDSGLMRGAANSNAIENIINSYGFGIGVGSERASSLIIALINNLGFVILFIFIYHIYKMIKTDKDITSNIAIVLFFVALIGSFAGNPEYTLAFMWVFLYAGISRGGVLQSKEQLA
ncbi:hypothetical protein [Klebsiella aerogenes]|uniref:hypothetical protein n=1 Tax=Klebsiella aerogenes TaxID=548 RepID=UPI0022787F18|nr:hypothetical protein [Klebsiella aerogenes]MCY4766099.1 hypothetical protein [Klebsiella aerogenes]